MIYYDILDYTIPHEVQTKTTQRMAELGMNFGVRYAYDSQKCTGPGDCWSLYKELLLL